MPPHNIYRQIVKITKLKDMRVQLEQSWKVDQNNRINTSWQQVEDQMSPCADN